MASDQNEALVSINACLNKCSTLVEHDYNDLSEVNTIVADLEYYITFLQRLIDRNPHDVQVMQELRDFCSSMLTWIKTVPVRDNTGLCSTVKLIPSLQPAAVLTSRRPKYLITKELLQLLRNIGYKWSQMATMLGVDRSTITRRVTKFGIQKSTSSGISDSELEARITQLHMQYPAAGYRCLGGFLHAQRIFVPLNRVNETLRDLFPFETQSRRNALKRRRKYHVPRANSLWHIDGHHSLIRFGLVIHGGIDGFSRCVTFMECSSNNRQDTVLKHFLKAVEQYGCPSRVRGDYGGENFAVCLYMIEQKGQDRGSFLAGSSIHNQRIERHWRDVFRILASYFYQHFYDMSNRGVLDVENDLHMAALHWVYLPRINKALAEAVTSWNNHKVSSERNWTPLMMWYHNQLKHVSEDATLEELRQYGNDWNGRDREDNVTQVVLDSKYELPARVTDVLATTITDVNCTVPDKGEQLFITARDIVCDMCSTLELQ